MFVSIWRFEAYVEEMRLERIEMKTRHGELQCAHDRLLSELGFVEYRVPAETRLHKKAGPERRET